MAIATTVVNMPLVIAARTPVAMPAKYGSSAVDDLLHHFAVTSRNVVLCQKRSSVPAHDVSQFKRFRFLRGTIWCSAHALLSPLSFGGSCPSKSSGLLMAAMWRLVMCR